VALEGAGKNFGSLDAKIDAAIFDGGNRGLRNAGELGQLTLTEFLEFAQDTDRFADGDFDAFPGRTKLFHFTAPDSRAA